MDMTNSLNAILKQAQQFQKKMDELQEELAAKRVEGTAGGGMVTVVVNGKQELIDVKIDPEVVNPDDVEILEDLVVAAANQAREKAQEMAKEEMGKIAGGLLPAGLAGLKIPGLF
jgi:DNA-binding YbaB/EbfC family protein